MRHLRIIIALWVYSLVWVGVAAGQQYDVDWHTVKPSGVVSSGGIYDVSGTIGQHDACFMSGGPYEVDGGFLAAPGEGEEPTIPAVSEWGLVIMALLLLVAGKVHFTWRRPVPMHG
ncbi:MAG: IPTL-CTERM sorting domain-containing protein [Phycisphaerales bacterium]|nr:MAG: IPTL-CTERM sorting domain-containing protein [Phycisphaerales bacterium]